MNTSAETMHVKNLRSETAKQRVGKVLYECLIYGFLLVMAGIVLFPFYWMLISSVKSLDEYRMSTPTFWPQVILLRNYITAFTTANLGRLFMNTMIVGLISTLLSLVITILTAFAFARLEFKGKELLFACLLATMMIPGDLTMISIYQLNRSLHLLNSYAGLIINGLISGFSILLMRNFFETVSYTLSESARLDGASEMRIFAGIYIPISLPGLATVFFMEYVARWNSITIPATLLTNESLYTLPLKLKMMILSTDSTSGTAQIPNNAIMAAHGSA